MNILINESETLLHASVLIELNKLRWIWKDNAY